MIITSTAPVELSERIARYLAKCAPSISGSGGHNQTFFVACRLVNGFDLSESEAVRWLQEYNHRCEPQWTEAELLHKVKQAQKATHDKPRGHMLGGGLHRSDCIMPAGFKWPQEASDKPEAINPCAELESFLNGYSVTEADALERSPIKPGDNWREDAATMVFHLYQPGENINIVTKYSRPTEGKANPAGVGDTYERDNLLEQLTERHPPESEAGAWVRMNPTDGRGVSDSNVTSYRYMLLESDSVSQGLWLSLMFRVPLPIAALIDSGNKSIHAWLRVDCATAEQYRETYERIQNRLELFGVDKSNKNPSRLSRLPGVTRAIPKASQQRLIYLDPKASGMDWTAFESALKVESKEQRAVRELFMARLYVPGEAIVEPIPVFSLQGVECCTVGNITALFASEGAGKSAVMGAAISSAIRAEGVNTDCLGWTASPLDGRCILHFDTEQSKEHRAKAMRRTAGRVGEDDVPNSVISVRMHGLSWLECQQLFDYSIEQALKHFPAGIHSIFMDGPGDFVPSVNDEERSNELVAKLMLYAERLQTHIINVIHLNHGSENDSKMRGHLGSQLARKSETTLKVTVKDDVRTLFAPKTRSAPIPVGRGCRFEWSDIKGMFISLECADQEAEKEEREFVSNIARKAFAERLKNEGEKKVSYGYLTSKIESEMGLKRAAAERRVKKLVEWGIVKTQVRGIYELI